MSTFRRFLSVIVGSGRSRDSGHVWSQIGYDKCFVRGKDEKEREKKATIQNFKFVKNVQGSCKNFVLIIK